MKKINQFLLLFLVATTAILMSCSTDIEPIDPAVTIPNPSKNGQLKVDIDGQTFVATNVQANVSAAAISITGLRSGNNDFVQITLPAPLNQIGTHTWAEATANNAILGLIYSNSSSEAFISAPMTGDFAAFPAYVDTAEVIVTSIDTQNKTISGTFSFTGGRVNAAGELIIKKFTNGSFTNIAYAGGSTTPSGNSFSAKMYDVPFNPVTITATANSGKILVTGTTTDMGTITVLFPATVAPGTYPISNVGDYVGMFLVGTSANAIFAAESGSLTIISHNTTTKKVKATFNFVGKSPVNETTPITEGAFEVVYQ